MSFRTSSMRMARLATAKATLSKRTFSLLANATTRYTAASSAAKAMTPITSIRGVKTINFGGTEEVVHERADWPKERLLDYFKNDTFALIGYGSQGYGQGLNLRDNGLNVIIGVRKGSSWEAAVEDGWVPGENLFEVDEAISRGTIIMDLLSDAAQSETWSHIKPQLTEGKTLYFSHGFSPVFKDLTHVEPPSNIDVILAAQKVLVELSDLYSKKVEVSTPHTLSGTMLPVKLKKRLLPWPLLLVLVTFTRPLLKEKLTPIYMVNVVVLWVVSTVCSWLNTKS